MRPTPAIALSVAGLAVLLAALTLRSAIDGSGLVQACFVVQAACFGVSLGCAVVLGWLSR